MIPCSGAAEHLRKVSCHEARHADPVENFNSFPQKLLGLDRNKHAVQSTPRGEKPAISRSRLIYERSAIPVDGVLQSLRIIEPESLRGDIEVVIFV